MILIPAIDIRGGNVVRLLQGDYNQEKQYSESPLRVAEEWVRQGARMIHIVDLDGAREGMPVNKTVIREIASTITVPIQVGGGIRTQETVSLLLESGVKRVVLGTKALDAHLLATLVRSFGTDAIVVGIDAVDGKVKTEGWLKDAGVTITELCNRVIGCGVRHIVVTDISRDGTLQGHNMPLLTTVLGHKELQVIASGGIGSLADISAIAALQAPNMFGVIMGKALYEGKFTLRDAHALLEQNKR